MEEPTASCVTIKMETAKKERRGPPGSGNEAEEGPTMSSSRSGTETTRARPRTRTRNGEGNGSGSLLESRKRHSSIHCDEEAGQSRKHQVQVGKLEKGREIAIVESRKTGVHISTGVNNSAMPIADSRGRYPTSRGSEKQQPSRCI